MSQGNRLMTFRVSEELYDLVQLALRQHNANTRGAQQGVSDWIRGAIREKLDHLARGRKGEKVRKYKCVHCGLRRRIEEIDNVLKPMWGKREYTCTRCVGMTGNPALNSPPNALRVPNEVAS